MNEFVLDERSIGIKLPSQRGISWQHQYLIEILAKFLYTFLKVPINYDHITTTVPKYRIPIKYRGKRYDLSFPLGDRVVFIQIDSLKLSKKRLREMWRAIEGEK